MDTSCASGMTQLDLVGPNRFAVFLDPEQEEGKMPDLDTADPEEIAQDECLGNKAEKGVVKEITPEEKGGTVLLMNHTLNQRTSLNGFQA